MQRVAQEHEEVVLRELAEAKRKEQLRETAKARLGVLVGGQGGGMGAGRSRK